MTLVDPTEGMLPSQVIAAKLRQRRAEKQDQQAEEKGAAVFFDWAMQVPEDHGPLNFDQFPPLRAIYSDEIAKAREVVIKKATQVGVTTAALRHALHAADRRGERALYIFPTQGLVHDFSDDRVDPILDRSPMLQARMRRSAVRQKKLKDIGPSGRVFFRGSESKSGAQSIPAQFLVFDEYDDLSQPNVEQMERRLSGAKQTGRVPRTWRVGVPRYPGGGIDERYEQSDKREWIVTCEQCGEEQTPTFFENLRWRNVGSDKELRWGADEPGEVDLAWRVCKECEADLDVAKGEWIAQQPGRKVIGFWITRMIIPGADLEEIVKNSRKRASYQVEAFWNNDLGEPFAPEEGQLSLAAIKAAQREYELLSRDHQHAPSANLRTMGVDVASVRDLTVRISEHDEATGKKRALWIGEVPSFNDLPVLMRYFHVNMAAIDHEPEGRLARSFAELFPGRVKIVHLSGTLKKLMAPDEEMNEVTVNRVKLLDATYELIRTQRNELPEAFPPDWVKQMRTPIRQVIVDEEDGSKKVVYATRNAPFDYAMAEAFDVMAGEMYILQQAFEQLSSEEFAQLDQTLDFVRSGLAELEHGGANEYFEGPQFDPTIYSDEVGNFPSGE